MDSRASPKAPCSRGAMFWKLLAAAAFGAAVSSVAVASCLERDERAGHDASRGRAETPASPKTSASEPRSTSEEASSSPASPSSDAAPPAVATEGEGGATTEQASLEERGAPQNVSVQTTPQAREETGGARAEVDAGPPHEEIAAGSNPFAPSMSAGAGGFTTEAPPWAASAMTPNLDAGAGAFTTEPPPYAASAMTANTSAGAGAFTTEQVPYAASAMAANTNAGALTTGRQVGTTPAPPVIVGLTIVVPSGPLAPGATGAGAAAGAFGGASLPVAEPFRGGALPSAPSFGGTAPTIGPMFGAPSPAGWPTTR